MEKTTINEQESNSLTTNNSKADIENFLRFVHENNLRHEAKLALEAVYQVIKPKKTRKIRKRKAAKTVQ